MHNNPLLSALSRPWPKRVAIIGAGTIGPDIGYYLKSQIHPLELTLVDISKPALSKARDRIGAYAEKGVAKGKISETAATRVTENLVTSDDYDAVTGVDWVLEAATEDLELKRKIFADCERRVPDDALLTSNTSSIPAERIFSELQHPERATVTHFFAPAFTNPIVEVVNWSRLAPEHLNDLRHIFAATGKVPMVTKDVVCFMLDRLFDNWCNEAAKLLQIASAAQIDTVAQRLVHAGPFFVLNLANGNPIIIETNELQAEVEGAHYRPEDIFRSVSRWNTQPPGSDVPVEPAVAAAIFQRLLGILMSQSLEVLDREIGEPQDLELGARLAFGFKQGPLELLESRVEDTSASLERLQNERPGMPQPKRALDSYSGASQFILIDDVEDVKVITLRRPEALNALDDRVNDEILGVLKQFENDGSVRGFVITGYGAKAFCAGADIGRFPSVLGDRAAAAQYARDCSNVLLHLDRMSKPVVAALNGLALGGGLELAMRCHDMVALENARLQFPEITLGIVPGIGAMVVPFRRWPKAASITQEMLMTARPLSARQAYEVGMVSDLAPDYRDLIKMAVTRVQTVDPRETRPQEGPIDLATQGAIQAKAFDGRQLSAAVLDIMQRCIADAAHASSFSEALELGYQAFGETACTADAKEGISAFMQGRMPAFQS